MSKTAGRVRCARRSFSGEHLRMRSIIYAFWLLLGGGAFCAYPAAADTYAWTRSDGRVVNGEIAYPKVRSAAPAVLMVSSIGPCSSHVREDRTWRLSDGQIVLFGDVALSNGLERAAADILGLAEDLAQKTRVPVALDAEGEIVRAAAKAYSNARPGLISGFWMTDPPSDDEEGWRRLVSGSVRPDGSVSPDRNLPALMPDVLTKESWERNRRPQVLKSLVENEFGVRPIDRPSDLHFDIVSDEREVLDGKAWTFLVRGAYSGPGGDAEMNFRVYLPKRDRPVPVFVHIAPRPSDTAADANGPNPQYRLPASEILSRGFAAISFDTLETAPDWKAFPRVPTSGVFKVFGPHDMERRGPKEWGIISAWSWGVSRVIDWIETYPRIDATRIAVVGLSRNGKAALATGAFDVRVALTVSCCSGTGGAKLNYADLPQSEHIRDMAIAKYWFAPAYWKWMDHDRELPFDQHWLLALVAPRLLYVSSAADDAWAGQPGEFASAQLASPVWELYGKKGLVAAAYPKDEETLHDGCIGYHRRRGPHTILLSDWTRYLDFAERHGWSVAKDKE